jgi:hypothetical protein
MQQVGGALGLSILSTVAVHVLNSDTGSVLAAAKAAGHTPSHQEIVVIANQAFAHGATTAFLVGAVMILVGSAIVWAFLNVSHKELATDGPEGGAHMG